MSDDRDHKPHGDRDWIDRVTTVASWFGLNPIRVRWKLEMWRERARRRREDVQTRAELAARRHQECPACGRLSDGSERTCSGCGAKLPSSASRLVRRAGLVLPDVVSVSALLAIALLAVHLRLMLADGGSILQSFKISTLVRFGAHWPPLVEAGEWWRLGTSIFLHVGALHIAFNLIALSQIGPAAEEVFGRLRMLLFFVVTGVAGNLVSELFGLDAVSAGASGGLMGLIGAAAGWGHRSGTVQGREIRNRMLVWAFYTMGFGFLIHADNGAHAGGFVAGAVLGLLVPARRSFPERLRPVGLVFDLAGVLTAGACVFLAVHPLTEPPDWVAFEESGTPVSAVEVEAQIRQYYVGLADVCRDWDAGRKDQALEKWRRLGIPEPVTPVAPGELDTLLKDVCAGLADVRRRCLELPAKGISAFVTDAALQRLPDDPAIRAEIVDGYRRMCDTIPP
ncbi:MAG: rhomboid family intramembrane serine protease [Deltaproteobacteria bacterium]|nr:rhomboid family intramembrane serine protease [Deltaproteobacteria bacterium]